jgi:hypothetical protein
MAPTTPPRSAPRILHLSATPAKRKLHHRVAKAAWNTSNATTKVLAADNASAIFAAVAANKNKRHDKGPADLYTAPVAAHTRALLPHHDAYATSTRLAFEAHGVPAASSSATATSATPTQQFNASSLFAAAEMRPRKMGGGKSTRRTGRVGSTSRVIGGEQKQKKKKKKRAALAHERSDVGACLLVDGGVRSKTTSTTTAATHRAALFPDAADAAAVDAAAVALLHQRPTTRRGRRMIQEVSAISHVGESLLQPAATRGRSSSSSSTSSVSSVESPPFAPVGQRRTAPSSVHTHGRHHLDESVPATKRPMRGPGGGGGGGARFSGDVTAAGGGASARRTQRGGGGGAIGVESVDVGVGVGVADIGGSVGAVQSHIVHSRVRMHHHTDVFPPGRFIMSCHSLLAFILFILSIDRMINT